MKQSKSDIQFLDHPDGRVAYRDEGYGETIVFVHGTPTSSQEYVGLFSRLKDTYRCLALDHLGFGCSDKPKDADYSIESHTSRLRSLLSQLSIGSFHLVVHDFGGIIGLPLASDETLSIRSLTIMNSWAWPLIETEPQMRSQLWLLRSKLMDWLYLYMNFSPKVLLKMAWGTHRPLTKEKHRAYQAPFGSPKERYGALAFKNTLLNFELPCWNNNGLARLSSLPVLLAWGMKDALVSPRNLDRWIDSLPSARVVKFERVGHFVADEGEELLASELRIFLNQVDNHNSLKF
ncbi:MAG: alpha/beta fold hydrolase [Pirellula sp.]|jgi:haloalkane dehalogenase